MSSYFYWVSWVKSSQTIYLLVQTGPDWVYGLVETSVHIAVALGPNVVGDLSGVKVRNPVVDGVWSFVGNVDWLVRRKVTYVTLNVVERLLHNVGGNEAFSGAFVRVR